MDLIKGYQDSESEQESEDFLSDGDDSEAEFNQILELCRKQREGVKSKTSARPSVNLAKVFDSEYYNLPPIDDPQIHVEEDISLKHLV
uniref:Uncharacterized protein n=1 Tax=Ditylenchus dipsaci TaxID=166011 RepID=A0A915ERB5_9BILA